MPSRRKKNLHADHPYRAEEVAQFPQVKVALAESTYVIGPNAVGKSNFLDTFRFLRTVSSPSGGSLKKLRCLQARRDPEVRVQVRVVSGVGEGYETQRSVVTEERVDLNGKCVLKRLNKEDAADKERLTQTHLEQVGANVRFRDLADFFCCDHLPASGAPAAKIRGSYRRQPVRNRSVMSG